MSRYFLRNILVFSNTTTSNTHFVTRTMSSIPTPSHRQFQLRVDPLTGNSEWVVIEEQESQVDMFTEPLLATTSYLDMLNDSPRNRAYCDAINKTVTKPCHVLDIGAGTGLLSMMAARAMSSSNDATCSTSKGMVTACESYLPMVKLMRKVLRANGMERKVRIINKRSDEVEVGVDIASRADVLVSEILDSEFLGEGLIPTLQHAHDKLLVDNPETVPYHATTYGQLVECKHFWRLHDLVNTEANVSDGIHLVPTGFEKSLYVKPHQLAMHCDALKEEMELLSEPFKIFEFDFSKRPDSYGEAELHVKATKDGTIHAVVSWWVLQLDREGSIFYSTAPKWISCPSDMNGSLVPGAREWCDHWKQCVWFTPEKGLRVCTDEAVQLRAIHTDTSISYDFGTQSCLKEVGYQQCAARIQKSQIALPPERMAIYGDNSWRCSFIKVLSNALRKKISSICVVADDSIFLTVAIAHLSDTSNVLSFLPGLREQGARYLEDVSVANGYSMDRVAVLNKQSQLTLHDTHERLVDLFIGEPFYYGGDNMLPWHNLRFWSERTKFNSILSEDVLIMPCKGILRACAMSLPDLWRSRRSLKEIVGFDHSVVNATLGACGDLPASEESPFLPFTIWQCGDVKRLSEVFTVMEFDFMKPIHPCSGTAKFTVSGICHGFVLWIDWVLDAENSVVIPTGPDQRYWKQGVKLLSVPVEVEKQGSGADKCCLTIISTSFDPISGEMELKHIFS
ncbi:hypothetical protein DCAR_0209586 [Daucus carota subsp. sativus]|uniref:Protein arginine N-methyltransferase domain-containing protein n=1 Tax=Daucus carota subsp. sativus TaxID=79200 RepID=A0AAF1APH5_DAUCS|nr:hypothetical protein DCAR_0209586 [Daucus carota subsp. sativus]